MQQRKTNSLYPIQLSMISTLSKYGNRLNYRISLSLISSVTDSQNILQIITQSLQVVFLSFIYRSILQISEHRYDLDDEDFQDEIGHEDNSSEDDASGDEDAASGDEDDESIEEDGDLSDIGSEDLEDEDVKDEDLEDELSEGEGDDQSAESDDSIDYFQDIPSDDDSAVAEKV